MTDENTIGGSIFWIIFILVALSSVIWLGIWSNSNNNLRGLSVTLIMFMLVVGAISLIRIIASISGSKSSFGAGTWESHCVSFSLFFVLWLFLGRNPNSVLALTQNTLFSTIATELPLNLEFVVNNLLIPVAEELFWMIALPATIIFILDQIGKKNKLFKNEILQLFIVILVCGITFGIFHVSKLSLAFLVGAFIFRTVLMLTIYTEQKFNWLPIIVLSAGGTLGAHIGNNWGYFGFLKGLTLMIETPVIGFIALMVLIPIFITTINVIGKALIKIGGKQ